MFDTMILPEQDFQIPKQILVIRTDRLGEFLLTIPAVRLLKESYPSSKITLIVNPLWESIAGKIPWIDRVISYQEKAGNSLVEAWRLVRLIRKAGDGDYDVAIAFHPKKSFHLASVLLGIPVRVGYARKWGVLLTHSVADKKILGDKHEVEYNVDLTRQLPGIEVPSTLRLFYPVSDHDRQSVADGLAKQGVRPDEPLVAIHPMTSDPRPWVPARKFVSLAHEIERRCHWRTLWIGSPDEAGEITPLAAQLGEPHLNLVGKLSLGELGALLERCKLLISIDSGPVHIAAAVGTPTLVIFGKGDNPGQPRRWGPWGNRHELLYRTSIAERERGYSLEELMVSVERCLH